MRIGQIFYQEHEGACVVAGIYKTCFTAWALEHDFPRFFVQNIQAKPNKSQVVESEYIPMLLACDKHLAFGRAIFYVYDGALECGMYINDSGDNLVLLKQDPEAHTVTIPRENGRWLLWAERDSVKAFEKAIA